MGGMHGKWAVKRPGVRILSCLQVFVDDGAVLSELPPSKPAEPLGPFGDMKLNSGGFFLLRFQNLPSEGSCR